MMKAATAWSMAHAHTGSVSGKAASAASAAVEVTAAPKTKVTMNR
jgi:hypothetical protein